MKPLLLVVSTAVAIASCSPQNSKEAVVERQKEIQAEIKAADDSLMAIRQSDTISLDHRQRPAAAWADEEKRKPLVQKKEVLQKEFDSLERELTKY